MGEYFLKEINSINHKEKYLVKEHTHNYFELVYYISGSGVVSIENKNFPFKSNSIAVLSPGTKHAEKSESEKVNLIYLGFLVEKANVDLSILKNNVYQCPKSIHLLNLLKEIQYLHENGDFLKEEIINNNIINLIHMISWVVRKNKNHSDLMSQIKTFINENLHKKISVELIAQNFNYDYDYLRKLFKKFFKCSINEYITICKLEKSMYYLKETNDSIESISKKLDFCTTSYYIKLFKKHFKITPKQFLLNYDKTSNKN